MDKFPEFLRLPIPQGFNREIYEAAFMLDLTPGEFCRLAILAAMPDMPPANVHVLSDLRTRAAVPELTDESPASLTEH